MKSSNRQSQKHTPSVYTFHVTALSHEGRGIARFDAQTASSDKTGKTAFIRYALPGETVRAVITNQTSRFENADMQSLIGEPSADRVVPPCPNFFNCGGCNVQHMQVEAQIEFKKQALASHLKHFAGLEPKQWLAPIRSLRLDYRHKARLGVRYLPKSKKLVMGFREPQSNHLVAIDQCSVLDHALSQSLPELKRLLERLHAKAHIGHIELAKGDEETALLIRHMQPFESHDLQLLLDFAKEKGWQLYLQGSSDSRSLVRIDQKQPLRLHYTLAQFGLNFAFSPLDFTQVNPTVNQQMVSLACELLELQQGEHVLDLFCGLGNFTLPLACVVGKNGRVVGVEGSQDMVARGQENAKRNNLSNVEFFSQDLTKDFSHHSWANTGFDALLIDPPRAGAYEIMQYIPNFGAKRIVYVSCNPATLARDASVLVEQGYQLSKVGVMDMFTHTGHVESIALFEKNLQQND